MQLASLRFGSQCEHHMLPFFGEARVVFVAEPDAPPLAPGTLQALLDTCSRRLQIQERLTQELVSAVHSAAGAWPASAVHGLWEGCHAGVDARQTRKCRHSHEEWASTVRMRTCSHCAR